MGFKDIGIFNKAMLAKKGWILQQNANSLAAKIFKEKYYRNGQFVEAKLGYKPSFMQRSLLAAQKLLKASVVWRLGNGRSIFISNHKWLPNVANFQVRSPVSILAAKSKFNTLVFEDIHCWNEKLVFEIFSREEAAQICSLPISRNGDDDRESLGASLRMEDFL